MKTCPRCGVSLPPASVSLELSAARCPGCHRLIDLLDTASHAPAAAFAIPKTWQVDAAPRALTVSWRWPRAIVFFLGPFMLVWNGMMMSFGLSASEGLQHPERLLFGLVIPHVWVGLGLAYYVLCLLTNTTTVSLVDGRLRTRHGPLWWPGKRDFDATDVRQLFVVEKVGSKGSRSYEVCVLRGDGRRELLVKTTDAMEARFLEHRFEQALGLVDQPVAGEHRG